MKAPAVRTDVPHLAVLDGLRGIAIVLVLWYHVWQISWLEAAVGPFDLNAFAETGSAGVDLFFFVSGFCLFYPYARAMYDGAAAPTLATFVRKRVLKIVPSYYLAIAALTFFGLATYDSVSDERVQLLTHLAFVHTLWPHTYGGISGVLWSIATEVQFYVVFPLLCWCAMRAPVATVAACVAGTTVYRIAALHGADPAYAIDRLPGSLDLFACGIFAAWAFRHVAVARPALAARAGFWTAVAFIGIALYALAIETTYPSRYDAGWLYTWKYSARPFFDASFVLVALGSLLGATWWKRTLANPALVFLSYVSYNLYLWHQTIARVVATLLEHVSSEDAVHTTPALGLAYTVVVIVASVGIAWMLTTFFERPIMRAGNRAAIRAPGGEAVAAPR